VQSDDVDAMLEMLAAAKIPIDRAIGITSGRIATTQDSGSPSKSVQQVVDMESYCISACCGAIRSFSCAPRCVGLH
jgi:hypothetical protein